MKQRMREFGWSVSDFLLENPFGILITILLAVIVVFSVIGVLANITGETSCNETAKQMQVESRYTFWSGCGDRGCT